MRFVPLFALLVLASFSALGGPIHVRAGGLLEQSDDVVVADRNCANTVPPALFGCGTGSDGRALAARGDLGNVAGIELGVGTTIGERLRLELNWTARDLDLAAQANFTGVTGVQPVHAEGRSQALLLNAAWLFRERDDVQPFVVAGAGIARNELEQVHYTFPTIGANAATIIQGGSTTGLAWNVGAGVSMRMTDTLFFDLSLRYTDLGDLETEAGDATIVRPTRTLTIPIDGTAATARMLGVSAGVRKSW
jgi:opacity protein-like surface antigen